MKNPFKTEDVKADGVAPIEPVVPAVPDGTPSAGSPDPAVEADPVEGVERDPLMTTVIALLQTEPSNLEQLLVILGDRPKAVDQMPALLKAQAYRMLATAAVAGVPTQCQIDAITKAAGLVIE